MASRHIPVAGFTLIEIIVTVAIIAAIAAIALPRIGGRSNELKSVVRKISVLCRELKLRAKLNNATYRLAINMSEEDRKPKHEFWVEKAQGEILNNYDPKNPPQLAPPEKNESDGEAAPPSLFSADTRILKKPEVLPAGLTFESVELANVKEPITNGLVYIHFFPSGYSDEAAIHLRLTEKIKWTLATQPLTGTVDILTEYKKLEDLRAQ